MRHEVKTWETNRSSNACTTKSSNKVLMIWDLHASSRKSSMPCFGRLSCPPQKACTMLKTVPEQNHGMARETKPNLTCCDQLGWLAVCIKLSNCDFTLTLSLSLSVFDKFLISLQVTVIDAARVVFIQLLHIMATRLAAGSSKWPFDLLRGHLATQKRSLLDPKKVSPSPRRVDVWSHSQPKRLFLWRWPALQRPTPFSWEARPIGKLDVTCCIADTGYLRYVYYACRALGYRKNFVNSQVSGLCCQWLPVLGCLPIKCPVLMPWASSISTAWTMPKKGSASRQTHIWKQVLS